MRAVVVDKPGEVSIAELTRPEAGPYQALVRTEVAALCNATDAKLVAGHFPGVDRYPLVLGHESAGTVESAGGKVRSFKAGQRVIGGLVLDFSDPGYASGWGGLSEYTLVNDHDAMVADGVADAAHGWIEVYEVQRPVPEDIPLDAAVLLCTWREVYAAFSDFHLKAGDDIVIFGAGPVGLSFVKIARLLGLGYVGVVEPVEGKRTAALRMGADAAFSPDDPRLTGSGLARGKPVDAVIDAVGKEAIANLGLGLVRLGGAVCIYGVLAEPAITIQKCRGPYNFNLYVHQWPTRAYERAAMEPLCNWIREGKLQAGEFITHEFPVERIGEALQAATGGRALKVLLRY